MINNNYQCLFSFDREGIGEETNNKSRNQPGNTEIPKSNLDEKEPKRKKEKKNKSKSDANQKQSADSKKVLSDVAQVPSSDKKLVLPERRQGPHEKLLITPGGLWYDLVSIQGDYLNHERQVPGKTFK